MPKKRLIDLTTRIANGNDVVLVGNDYDTFNTKINTLPINTTFVLADNSDTPRTLGERFGEVINVKDFGAVGDGEIDDGPAINDAFLVANGKTVIFPQGVYALNTGEINLCQTAHIIGYNATIKQTTNNHPCFRAELNTDVTVTIEGINFLGVGRVSNALMNIAWPQPGALAYGIILRDANNCIIQNCTFSGFQNAAILISNGQNILIDNNVIVGTRDTTGVDSHDTLLQYREYGIHLQNSDVEFAKGCRLTNNHISNTFHGIYVDEKYQDTTIDNNTIHKIGKTGIEVFPANNLSISNNVINARYRGISIVCEVLQKFYKIENINIFNNNILNTGDGINVFVIADETAHIYSSFYFEKVGIYNNIIKDLIQPPSLIPGQPAIRCRGIAINLCMGVSIHGNNISNFDGIGIFADGVDGVIRDNIITNVLDTGIDVVSTPEGHTVVQNNVLTECSQRTSLGVISVRPSYEPEQWRQGALYFANSYVTLTATNQIFKNVANVGVSATTPPNADNFTDHGLVWKYVGDRYTYPAGNFDVHQNIVTLHSQSSANYGFSTGDRVQVKWSNNIFPKTLQNYKPLFSLVQGNILSDSNNIHGGYQPVIPVSSVGDRTYQYAPYSNGCPARNFIDTQTPARGDGYWLHADRIWNDNPHTGDYVGWICVSAGDPGSWEPFGYLGVSGTAATIGAPNPGVDASDAQVVIGYDSRLTDSRVPLSHASTHSKGSTDPINANSIGAFDISNDLSEIGNTDNAKRNLQLGSFADYNMPPIPQTASIITDQMLILNYSLSALEWVPVSRTTQVNKYVSTLGNGLSSHFIVQHNLNSTDLFIQTYDMLANNSTNISTLSFAYTVVDQNTIDIDFGVVLQTSQCKIVVIT